MAGGNLYIEPILKEVTDKIADIVDKIDDMVDVIEIKVQEQIEQLQKVVTTAGAGIAELNVIPGTSETFDIEYANNVWLGTQRFQATKTTNLATITSFCNGQIKITTPRIEASTPGYSPGITSGSLNFQLVDSQNVAQTIASYNMVNGQTYGPTTANLTFKSNEQYTIRANATSGDTDAAMGGTIIAGEKMLFQYDISNPISTGAINIIPSN